MAGKVLEIQNIIARDNLSMDISGKYDIWRSQSEGWRNEKRELRNFVFATDTSTTSNNESGWKNTTTIPKLCQIRDNLHANYRAALFPNDDWMRWEAYTADANQKQKKDAIQAYMENKVRESDFMTTVSQLLYDYIDYGNAFAEVHFVNESTVDPLTGETLDGYIGPKLVRISPLDLVFNPTAPTFKDSPVITRYIKTVGELKCEAMKNPHLNYDLEVIQKIINNRNHIGSYGINDLEKVEAYSVDGFGSLWEYYQSGYVEILEFEGTIYDSQADEFLENQIITIIDRAHVLRKMDNPSWFGKPNKMHVGWRLRPDNLYAMGPLDNLVGMQYRIDHLENAKADALDLTIHPPIKVIGEVEEFVWGPGEEIIIDEGGDVVPLPPNPAALQVNNEIVLLQQEMEELAGAPKQAMGVRTPGEKTMYEVQSLENAAGRIFQDKITHFEIQVVEVALNMMLEISKRNMDGMDIIRVMDDDLGVQKFLEVTRDDITAKGKLRPVGARHFAMKAQLVQNLTNFANSAIGQDPTVNVHLSGKKLAKLFEEVMGLERFGLFQDNIRIIEQMETQRLTQTAQESLDVESTIDTEIPLDEQEMPVEG